MNLRAACVAWKFRGVRGDGSYFAHFYDLVSAAHDEGADLVIFPELHVLELLPLARDLETKDAPLYLVQYGEAIEGWIERISNSSEMIIVGGSHFRETPDGIKNVCAIAVPGQGVRLAEKNCLTEFERTIWNVVGGKGLAKLPYNLGVTIGYDNEFSGSARSLAETGCLIQCAPAWAPDERSFQRSRHSCLARAVENQTFVLHSSLVGELKNGPILSGFGSSAIIAPLMDPFPSEPLLRETAMNEEGVVLADLDVALLGDARANGSVRTWQDRHRGDWSVVAQEPTKTEMPASRSEEPSL